MSSIEPEPKPLFLQVFCWNCWINRDPEDKTAPETFKCRQLKDGKIISKAFQSKHLDYNEQCDKYYWNELNALNDGLRTSLIEHCPHQKHRNDCAKKKDELNNKAVTMGVSTIPYRPVGRKGRNILDCEVMYNPSIDRMDPRLTYDFIYEESFYDNEIWFPTDVDANETSEETLPTDCPEGFWKNLEGVPNNDSPEGSGECASSQATLATNMSEREGSGEVSSESVGTNNNNSNVDQKKHIIETHSLDRYLSPQLKIKIKLMKIFRDHNIPVGAEKEIYEWAQSAHEEYGFSWDNNTSSYASRQSIFRQIFNTVPDIQGGEFKKATIDWQYKPDPGETISRKGKKEVFVRSFGDALRSLLTNKTLVKEENLSFPNSETPLSPEHLPALDSETLVSELHHGAWWTNTWKRDCSQEKNEILVPIILYMDGIAIDNAARNSLCPLNLTLGIFNDVTRSTKPEAWETIYFHPQDKAKDAVSNMNNLHTGLRCALDSVRRACEKENIEEIFEWRNLPWNGQNWHVRMKFAIAFVIGDTELHDKLCGHYGCKGKGVAQICRHCNVPTQKCNQPRASYKAELWTPKRLNDAFAHPSITSKDISHYPIKNAFHDINFGVNEHNIHLATPGEKLHMHQLGCAKRAVDTFKSDFLDKIRDKTRTLNAMDHLCEYYGSVLTRQSDRDFPRTKFTESISTARKEGSHFAGMLFTQMLAMASTEGRKHLNHSGITDKAIDCRIYAYELLNGMEEFLKYSGSRGQLENMRKMCIHVVNTINLHLPRKEGAGNVLVKVHLILHLVTYILEYGPTSGQDSAPSETNHKGQIKAPAKRTQLNGSTLIEQTCSRHMEYRRIDRLHKEFPMYPQKKEKDPPGENGIAAGSRFVIRQDEKCGRSIKWGKKQFKGFNPEVLRFCCEEVLPVLEGSPQSISGFTEHVRYNNHEKIRFRAHPCYRSNSGQTTDVWYDWAYFYEEEETISKGGTTARNKIRFPAQIMCFLHLPGPFTGESVSGFKIDSPGFYAVVRRIKNEKEIPSKSGIRNHKKLSFMKRGEMEHGLFLYHCNSIAEEAAVVMDRGNENHYLILGNRGAWLKRFRDLLKYLSNITELTLYQDGKQIEKDGRRIENDTTSTSEENRQPKTSNKKRKLKK